MQTFLLPDIKRIGCHSRARPFSELSLQHSHSLLPVDAIAKLPRDMHVVTTNRTEVCVWDFAPGGAEDRYFMFYDEAVTTFTVACHVNLLRTQGLDSYVKFHDPSPWHIESVTSVKAQVLSVALNADGRCYGIGLADCRVDIRPVKSVAAASDGEAPSVVHRPREFEG